MRKNFNEYSTVMDMINNGFTIKSYQTTTKIMNSYDDWSLNTERKYSHGLAELNLLIKYYSGLGLKPAKIKELIKELWINYNPTCDFKIIDDMIKKIRKRKDYKLIEIDEINIPLSIFNWIKQTCEELLIDEIKREKIDNTELAKVLFTIYCWAELQKIYKEYGAEYICLDTLAKLKKNAYLKPSTKVNNCVFILKDNDLLDVEIKHKIVGGKIVNSYYQITTKFNNIIPAEVVTDDRQVSYNNLNNIKFGQEYQRHFNLPEARPEKEPLNNTCPKCGKEFERKSHRRDELCEECRKEREREKDRLKKQKKREKIKKQREGEN